MFVIRLIFFFMLLIMDQVSFSTPFKTCLISKSYARLSKLQRNQIDQFNVWADNENWSEFANSHYDWWTFPIDKPSVMYDGIYTIKSEDELNNLKNDEEFILRIKEASKFVLQSWGWNIDENQLVVDRWKSYKNPTRLYKIGRCLKLFELNNYFKSLKKFAETIEAQGVLKLWIEMEREGFKFDESRSVLSPYI